jgi:deoxyribonuclease V
MQNSWDVSPAEAIAIQKELREQVRLVPLKKAIRFIGGADVSMDRFAKEGFGGFVALSYPGLTLVAKSAVKAKIPFPYIPGLLSFREIPMLLRAWKKLKQRPDVLVVDGVGIAHPRRLGIASHLGLVLGIPTIGCAKSVLTGAYEEPPDEPGSFTYLRDRRDPADIIGAAVRTKRNVKPVFVSPGHLITLQEAIDIVRSCVVKHRLPEPTRLAHLAVNEARLQDNERTGGGLAAHERPGRL